MSAQLSPQMRDLLLAMNLGRSTAHPLAGWHALELLYRDGSAVAEPITIDFLVRRYNAECLTDTEKPITNEQMKSVLAVLVGQARLAEEVMRKVRKRLENGRFIIRMNSVFQINSAGIEYLKAMQRVVDAENTVVASTKRIGEYCELIEQLANAKFWQTDSMALFNRFQKMLTAYDEVMNGLRKLDVDLHDIATDLAFDHGGVAAQHLQTMLHEQAIPAYQQMQNQAQRVHWLAGQTAFADAVAFSRQNDDNLDVQLAIGDASKLALQRRDTSAFVTRRLVVLAQSFDPSTSAISTSFDSIYLLFQTLWEAVRLLSREFDHVQQQSVDIKALTADIDQLMAHHERLVLPAGLPKHLPMDRLTAADLAQVAELDASERAAAIADLTATVQNDMLEAGAMGAVVRQVQQSERVQYTEADNPTIAEDADVTEDDTAAIAEFTDLLMRGANTVVVDRPLTFTSRKALDAAVTLFAATQYEKPEIFAPFGRWVSAAKVLPATGPVVLRMQDSDYGAELPAGFTAELQALEDADD